MAWERVFDNPVLSHYFPTAPFPVWSNHRNIKNILSYKNKIFQQDLPNREYRDYTFQKFNRPKPTKRRKTLQISIRPGLVVISWTILLIMYLFSFSFCYLSRLTMINILITLFDTDEVSLRERKLCHIINSQSACISLI